LALVPADPRNWVGGGPAGANVCTIVAARREPATLYAGIHDGGVLKSTDGGTTWTAASRGLPPFSGCPLAIDPERPGTLYAEVFGRLYKTSDAGAGWASTDAGLPEAHLPAIGAGPRGSLYTATEGGLFKSDAGGRTWARVRAFGIPDSRRAGVLIDPSAPATLYVRSQFGVFRSRDRARTFTAI